MYSEEQFLPLSAVGQYVHCPRRFVFLHVEQQWEDNRFTAEGTVLHEKADSGVKESRGSVRIIRSIRLRSYELGVTGIADVVEFHRVASDEVGISLPKTEGKWRPYPVEYKRGAAQDLEGYKAQLCLQALCLEEMLDLQVPAGALFLGEKQGRLAIEFTTALRAQVVDACHAMQRLFASGETQLPSFGKWCKSCSLFEDCRPKLFASRRSAKKWLEREMEGPAT
ncbi:MAG: CRISPR-associated protein Cas4 [Kiritimatiellae bacterium]|nr:CRISPR-associated protein Cas4 [Kiritimatiellia bacterium]